MYSLVFDYLSTSWIDGQIVYLDSKDSELVNIFEKHSYGLRQKHLVPLCQSACSQKKISLSVHDTISSAGLRNPDCSFSQGGNIRKWISLLAALKGGDVTRAASIATQLRFHTLGQMAKIEILLELATCHDSTAVFPDIESLASDLAFDLSDDFKKKYYTALLWTATTSFRYSGRSVTTRNALLNAFMPSYHYPTYMGIYIYQHRILSARGLLDDSAASTAYIVTLRHVLSSPL